MSQIKNFTATVHSGIAGYFIQVKGEVNCGMLTVTPTLTKKEPPGMNRKILILDVYPASNDPKGSFSEAEYNENIDDKETYTDVQLIDPSGNTIETLPVTQAHSQQSATK